MLGRAQAADSPQQAPTLPEGSWFTQGRGAGQGSGRPSVPLTHAFSQSAGCKEAAYRVRVLESPPPCQRPSIEEQVEVSCVPQECPLSQP